MMAGIWLSTEEIMALPTSGEAWDTVYSAATGDPGTPNISNQDSDADVHTLAKALVGVRLGDQGMINEARANIMDAINTEDGGRTLALGRNLASYVIAADIVGLSGSQDSQFRDWLRDVRSETLSGRTLISTHEDRPNNWGTMAGASRAAVAAYLGDQAELDGTASVFRGYVGDRSAYADFKYGSLSWQVDPSRPVGINPAGATKDGHSIDGVMPDDMRRGGDFSWPPGGTGYPWEGLQGAIVQAEILHRQGYDAWDWEDQALLRAVNFLYDIGWEAEGDDTWQVHLINARYGTDFAEDDRAGHGKIMGWTSWTHSESSGDGGNEQPQQPQEPQEPQNQRPVVNAGSDQTIQEGQDAELNASVSDDGRPEPVETTWSVVSGPGSVDIADASAVDTDASFDSAGTYVLRLTASDGDLTASDSVTIVVSADVTNQAPVVDAGSDKTAQMGEPVHLNASVADDGQVDPVQTAWKLMSGPGPVTFANMHATDTMAEFSAEGTYMLRLTATDGEMTASDDVMVRIEAESGDGIPIGDEISFQDGAYPTPSYSGTRDTKIREDFADQALGTSSRLEMDGNPDMATLIRWDVSTIPAGSRVAGASITFDVFNTSGDAFEIYQVLRPWTESSATFNAYDAGAAWSSPGASGSGDRGTTVLGTVTAPTTGSIAFDLNSAGIDVVQSWVDDPSSNFGFVVQNFENARTDDLDASSREVGQAAARPKLTILLEEAPDDGGQLQNQRPTVNAGADQTVQLGQAVNLNATVSDDGRPGPLQATWSEVSGPGSVSFAKAGAVDTTALFSAEGTYVLRLTVSDGELTSSDEVSIRVESADDDPVTPSATGALVEDVHLFYNSSSHDGNGAAVTTADFDAIATDKSPLTAGNRASFDHMSGYSRGINGLFIDVSDLPGDGAAIGADDLAFTVGNNDLPDTWADAPAPTDVGVFPNAGPGGEDRIFVTFADEAIADTWLGITVLPTAATGLADASTYFYGSVPGDTGKTFMGGALFFGHEAADMQSIAVDLFKPAGITNANDVNRDGTVDAFDLYVIPVTSDGGIKANVVRAITPQAGAPVLAAAAVDAVVAEQQGEETEHELSELLTVQSARSALLTVQSARSALPSVQSARSALTGRDLAFASLVNE